MRTRMYGGVGGEEPRGFPLSRLVRRLWLGQADKIKPSSVKQRTVFHQESERGILSMTDGSI